MATVIKTRYASGTLASISVPAFSGGTAGNMIVAGELAFGGSATTGVLVIGTGVQGANAIIGGAAFFDQATTAGKTGTGVNVLASGPTLTTPSINVIKEVGNISAPLVSVGTASVGSINIYPAGTSGAISYDKVKIWGALEVTGCVLFSGGSNVLTVNSTVTFGCVAAFSYADGIVFSGITNSVSNAYVVKAATAVATSVSTIYIPFLNTTTPDTFATLAANQSFTNKTGYNGLVITANTGVITTGTWNGTVIGATYGGTGVNNGSNTITLAGSLVTTGAFTTTLTVGATTTLTLPATGTLATLAGSESFINKTGFNGLAVTANTGVITTGTWNGTVIGATYGGTGLTSYTTGDLLYSNPTNTLAKLAVGTTGQVLKVVSGLPAWGAIDLAAAAAVTGILPLANGGTGVTLATTGPGFLRQASANATVTVSPIVAADLPGSFNGFATPATSIGLTATAGSAATAMRSDGAPALSVAIAPTWTAQHIFSNFAPQCSVAPTGDSNLANKLYVDTVAQGLHVHPPADVILLADLATTVTGESTFLYASPTASTTTITITGTAMTFTVDSVVMANWTRIVIAGESSTTPSTSSPNKEWHGIYTKTTSTTTSIVLTRASDADYVSDLNGGDFIFIQSGTIYADTGFVQIVSSALGTIAFASANAFYPAFVQFSQAGVIAAGNGLEKTGVTLAVKALDTSITVASGGISVGIIDGGSF